MTYISLLAVVVVWTKIGSNAAMVLMSVMAAMALLSVMAIRAVMAMIAKFPFLKSVKCLKGLEL